MFNIQNSTKMENEEKKTQQRKAYAKRGEAAQKMMSLRIDTKLLPWLKSKANMGRYINELIRKDMRSAWVGDDEHTYEIDKYGDYEDINEMGA